MRKGLRSSARKEQEVQSKSEERTRLRDRSIELYQESERDKEALNKQIEELCSKDNPEQSSSEESVVGAGDESDAEESLKVDPPQKFVSESSLVWDGQGHLQSPLKDTSRGIYSPNGTGLFPQIFFRSGNNGNLNNF